MIPVRPWRKAWPPWRFEIRNGLPAACQKMDPAHAQQCQDYVRAAQGIDSRVPMLIAPADSPKTMTLRGSPPNAAVFSLTIPAPPPGRADLGWRTHETQVREAGVGEPRRGPAYGPLRPDLHRMLLRRLGFGAGCVSLRSQEQHQPGQHGERV